MKHDLTSAARRALQARINFGARTREELEEAFPEVLSTDELTKDYHVRAFLAPFVRVVRKSDGKPGWLMFQHAPRFYFDFQPE